MFVDEISVRVCTSTTSLHGLERSVDDLSSGECSIEASGLLLGTGVVSCPIVCAQGLNDTAVCSPALFHCTHLSTDVVEWR